jgi:hypothetical protein
MNLNKRSCRSLHGHDVPVLLEAVLDANWNDERPVFCTTKETSDDVGSPFPNGRRIDVYSLVESISFRYNINLADTTGSKKVSWQNSFLLCVIYQLTLDVRCLADAVRMTGVTAGTKKLDHGTSETKYATSQDCDFSLG